MTLLFDAFSEATPTAWNVGQPIVTPPILSVNERNEPTINLSTGDQDALGAAPGMKNYVWSLYEKPVPLANGDTGSFVTNVNWYRPLIDGERVTGPMVLFDSDLFFSTFKPVTAVCKVGESNLWSMHYTVPAGMTPDTGGAATGRIPGTGPGDPFVSVDTELLQLTAGSARTAVFGAALTQQPTCTIDDTSAVNEYLGYGTHKSIGNVMPGTFEVVFHTGLARPGPGATGIGVSDGAINAVAIEVGSPKSSSRIDSWAAIVE
jgi:hypothetical protein